MRSLILVIIPFIMLFKSLAKNHIKNEKNLKKSMRSQILIIIPFIMLFKSLVKNHIKNEKNLKNQ